MEGMVMEQKIEEKEVVKNQELCFIKIKRIPAGISIYCQSEQIEEFFKGLSKGITQTGEINWGKGKEFYKTTSLKMSATSGMTRPPEFGQWGADYLIMPDTNYNNFSFLRAVGLKDGVTFEFCGLFTKEMIEEFRSNFKIAVQNLYTQYIKVFDFEITLRSII